MTVITDKDARDSSARQSMLQWAVGCVARVRFPPGTKVPVCSIYTSSGAHPASYPVGTRALPPRVKWPVQEPDHSPPSSAKVNGGPIPPLHHMSSWCDG
jgi:hypothetical protein